MKSRWLGPTLGGWDYMYVLIIVYIDIERDTIMLYIIHICILINSHNI
jgi:hypothetical protein